MVSENIYSWFLKESIDKNKFKATIKGRKEETVFNKQKRELLENLIRKVNDNAKERINFVQSLIDKARDALNKNGSFVIDFEAKTTSRLMINTANGLGFEVFEIGIAFHPIFNLPYIPSSAIKGSLRSYIHFYNEKEEKYIFGDDEIGKLIVLDAFPKDYNKTLLDADVITSIYGEDIEEHKAKPNPVIYPCIAKGVTFRFVIGISNRIKGDERKDLQSKIFDYFFEMANYGIGAKTLVGYGILEKVSKNG
ncbi:hypothetical protein HRbin06_00877 [archaeon HR06]|nr:hypothetical protein HRbin06_00877 [archaeon HR06]